MIKNQALQWLLDSDPSIRWQAMQDIIHASSTEVDQERVKIATEGRGSVILAEQNKNGTWSSNDRFPEMVTLRTLYLLYQMGLDPNSE